MISSSRASQKSLQALNTKKITTKSTKQVMPRLEFGDNLSIFPRVNTAEPAIKILEWVDKATLMTIGSLVSKDWYQAILGKKFTQNNLLITKLQQSFNHSIDIEIFNYYVKPLAKLQVNAETNFCAIKEVNNFILNKHLRSLLVLGDSGHGKSLLSQYITWQLWRNYEPGQIIPLFIHLPIIPEKKRKTQLLSYYLKSSGLNKTEITGVLQEPLILILDGYDEIPEVGNLYLQNHWDKLNIKIITTCRPEVLLQRQMNGSYQELFLPKRTLTHTARECFTELYLSQFNDEQINQYLAQYLEYTGSSANWQEYKKQLETVPGLLELVATPFILSMIVRVLPKILEKYQTQTKIEQRKLVRTEIYDYFVDYWFDYQVERLQEQGKLINLTVNIKDYLKTYSQNLAYYALREGKLEVTLEEQYTLNKNLLQPKDDKLLLDYQKDADKFTLEVIAQIRSGCLLKNGIKYFSFLHKSLIEYFAAQDLFVGIHLNLDTYLQELNLSQSSTNFGLNENLLTTEPTIIYTLADRVLIDNDFKQLLYDVIEFSKTQELVNIAAANAITILNVAGESFSGKDFSKIHIAGANLSGAICNSTNFFGADLRGVNFSHAWLCAANFAGANLQNVDFAELPNIEHNCEITSICIDPNGHWLLIGDVKGYLTKLSLDSGKIVSSNRISSSGTFFKKVASFIGFAPINLAISPDGKLAAITNFNNTVHLWDIIQDKQISELILENKRLTNYTPDYTNSDDGYEADDAIEILLFCPPYGKKLIFGCTYYHDIEMRDIINNKFICNFATCTTDLAISPDGKILAFATFDGLDLYDLTNLVFSPTDIKSYRTPGSYECSYSDVSSDKKMAFPTLRLPIKIRDIVVSPTGKWLGGNGEGYEIVLVNTNTWEIDKIVNLVNTLCRLSFSSNEDLLIVSLKKELQIWHIESASYMYNLLYPERHQSNALSLNKIRPLLSSVNNQICYYPVKDKVCSWLIKGVPNPIKYRNYFSKKIEPVHKGIYVTNVKKYNFLEEDCTFLEDKKFLSLKNKKIKT